MTGAFIPGITDVDQARVLLRYLKSRRTVAPFVDWSELRHLRPQ